ncbi:MAG: PA14 domain-containing protein, partial [Salinivenus sp.]
MSPWLLTLVLVAAVAGAYGILSRSPAVADVLSSVAPRRWSSQILPHPVARYGRLMLIPTAVGVVLLAGAFSFNLFQLPTNTITLPIEVIGPDGHTVSVQVNASTVSDVERLSLKAHSIGYPYHLADGRGYTVDKASIRLNDGSWVDVNNQTVTCRSPEAEVRCVDGPMHTIRFEIPISELGDLNSGANMIDFRFNYAHPGGELGDPSTGYRILDIRLETAAGVDRIDGTTFTWDDPGTWAAPDGYQTQSAVQAGKELWYKRDHLVDGWNGEQIRASCSDCHVENGYDLQYFAFSNKSIIQRSRFHDLSETEGKQIAAYIRSIQIETEDGTTIDPPGRPWAPPYQPGPTSRASRAPDAPRTDGTSMDDLPAVYWAAGAGLDWALDSDQEMKPFLFPNGIVPNDITMDRKLNTREMPVALQMPDWNEWLPAVHPMDVWGSTFTESDSWKKFQNDIVDAHDATNFQDVVWATKDLWKIPKKKFRPSSAPAPYDDPTDYGVANLSRAQWALTKTFELLQPHHFENDTQDFYGPAAEPRQWPSTGRIVFDQAPHILGEVKGPKSNIMDRYHDTAWYQHQMTLNPGSGMSTSLLPVDWKYHYGHLSAVTEYGKHAFRFLYAYAKVTQVANEVPNDWSNEEPDGWYLRHLTPGVIDANHYWFSGLRDALSDDEYRRALNVLLTNVGEGLTDENPDSWARQTGSHGLDPADAYPEYIYRYDKTTYPDHFWTSLKNFGDAGASYEVLEPIAQWASKAWPSRDWMAHIEPYKGNPPVDTDGSSNETPSARLESPMDGATFGPTETITLEARASDPDGSVASVEFYRADSSLGTDASAPYRVGTSDLSAGYHRLTATATDDQGATTTTAPLEIAVETADGTLPPEPGVARAYYEGTWQQVPDYDALSPLRRDTTSTFSIASPARSDHFGYRLQAYLEVTEKGSYSFHLESDDGSKMYVNGSLLIDNGGTHGAEEVSGTATLSEGYHRVVVDYFDDAGGQTLSVAWTPPDSTKGPIPERRLYAERPRTTVTQTIPLAAGWNLVSSRVRPEDPSMRSVFGDVLDLVVLAKDETGAVFSPTYDVTALDTWVPVDGYQVYMKRDTSLTVQGQALRSTTPIPLAQGWNVVSYLPPQGMPVEEAFGSLG